MYLEQQDPERAWILDIECDSLEPTQVWCVCVENLKSDEQITFTNKQEFNDWLQESKKVLIGHNLLSFDTPVLNRLWDSGINHDDCIDSLILSYLYHPGIPGGHSLGAYGERLIFPKADFNDWSKLSDEMVSYCQNDVRLTKKLYLALSQKMRKLKFSELSCRIEHEIRIVINDQELHGFWFDRAGAESLLHKLRERQSSITQEIQALFPPALEEVARFKYRCKKDGSPSASYERHRQKYLRVEIVGDEYVCYDYVTFNLGSPKQRVTKLLSLGWVPQKFTKTKTDEFPQGFPQVNEDSLVAFSEESGRKEIAALAEWLVLQGRSSMIDTWLNNVKPDSRIHGRVLSCGAATRRMVHFQPNSANIPSGAKAKYGHECRALWGVEPGKGLIQVGVDASSLETIGLLHYLPSKYRAEAEKILNQPKPNDIHSLNSRKLTELLGRFIDRDWGAKTSWYACVPLDTKILTRRGWKFYNEVVIGEDVLGYNQETKLKEWTTLRDIILKEDEVFDISNAYKSFKATGDHRWFVRQRGTGKRPLKEHYLVDEIRTTNQLTRESSILINAPFNEDQDVVSKVKGLDGKYDVDWEQRVLDMSHSERVQFLQGFLLADGWMLSNGNWAWSQNKNNLAEGLILASYLAHDGYLSVSEKDGYNDKMVSVRLSKKSHITNQRLKKTSLGLQQVWCPTTDLGSWVMKQHHSITITGNCLYGAYPAKLAQIVKGPQEDGEVVQDVLFNSVPGLRELIESVQSEWREKSGRLLCIDDGYVICPSASAALNYKIQSLGSIVMKLACIILHKRAKEMNLWFRMIGNIHDEFQMEAKVEDGERLGKLAVWSIEEAARQLKFNLKLTGEYRLGNNWNETH